MEGRGTAALKGASLGGRLNRRDESARRKNDKYAGRNSNGHRTRSVCVVNGPTLFRRHRMCVLGKINRLADRQLRV
jgi:hypothetical protein